MQDVFFSATKKALANITSTFDTVWPIAAGLWNLRCSVNGIRKEYPAITERELAAKYSVGSEIHGVNYKKAFENYSWEKQKSDFAWILLNSTIPIFEGWLDELEETLFNGMKVKEMQFPTRVRAETSRLTANSSAIMKNSFYAAYQSKRDRNYSQIDALMHCYRVFKEARNCYMHNGSKANDNLINAFRDYMPFANCASLSVSEVPEFLQPVLNHPVEISLRGVVGLSYILIKIIVSLDTELICATNSETEFVNRYQATHVFLRTLKPDPQLAEKQIEHYVMQCGFHKPQAVGDIKQFLLSKDLVSR